MDLPKPIRQRTVEEAYGRRVFYETFTEPATPAKPIAGQSEWLLFESSKTPAIVFPLDEQHRVVAIRQYRYAAADMVLELPGGLIDTGESVFEAAMRELREEAGHVVSPHARFDRNSIRPIDVLPTPLGTADADYRPGTWFDPCCFKERFLSVIAEGCHREGNPTEPYIHVELYPVEQWYKMLAAGAIVDAKTYAVSILALRHLEAKDKEAALRGLAS